MFNRKDSLSNTVWVAVPVQVSDKGGLGQPLSPVRTRSNGKWKKANTYSVKYDWIPASLLPPEMVAVAKHIITDS